MGILRILKSLIHELRCLDLHSADETAGSHLTGLLLYPYLAFPKIPPVIWSPDKAAHFTCALTLEPSQQAMSSS